MFQQNINLEESPVMDYIWGGMILLSLVFGACNGRMQEVSDAVFSGAGQGVEVCIALLGAMCFWSGLMKIADRSGITIFIGRLCRPIIRVLFPTLGKNSPAAGAMSLNFAANILGLGNAATPLGLKAMKCLQAENPRKDVASDNMLMFVVINTASLQIIPTTVATLRVKYGSVNPLDIMPAVWIASIGALLVGVLLAKLLNKWRAAH